MEQILGHNEVINWITSHSEWMNWITGHSEWTNWIIDLSNLTAAFLLIYGLKQMSSPVTARRGILLAGYGMLVVVLVSFLYAFGVEASAKAHLPINLSLAVVALLLGLGWARHTGRTVAITAMPQMVAIYNGLGGGAAAAIAAVELFGGTQSRPDCSDRDPARRADRVGLAVGLDHRLG